jgi:sugar diacid utilization regulator
MASLSELTSSPALRTLVDFVVRPELDPEVSSVAIVEALEDLEQAREGSLALLASSASAAAGTYRFDVGLRLASRAKVSAVVLTGEASDPVTSTAAAIAERTGVGVLRADAEAELATLAIVASRELGGGPDVALMRAHAAMRALDLHPDSGRPEALVEVASRALGVPLRLGDEPEATLSAPVVIDGEVETHISAEAEGGDMKLAVELVLDLTAAALSRALAAARRDDELPIRSGAEVLTELMAATPQEVPGLVRRARQLSIPIDGWHLAVRIEFENAQEVSDDGEVAAFEARQTLFRSIVRLARASGGVWHTARAGSGMVLLRMYRDDPGPEAVKQVREVADAAIRSALERVPGAAIRCGVGGVHAGTSGPVSSANEARAAVAVARAGNRVNRAVAFDSVGLRRTLVEWYASATAREAVRTVLAPLDDLSPSKASQAVQTLQAYLDRQGSLSKTAEALHLHRNAVSYRINRIFSVLDVDRDNPDDLLLLQLACRAREMS